MSTEGFDKNWNGFREPVNEIFELLFDPFNVILIQDLLLPGKNTSRWLSPRFYGLMVCLTSATQLLFWFPEEGKL